MSDSAAPASPRSPTALLGLYKLLATLIVLAMGFKTLSVQTERNVVADQRFAERGDRFHAAVRAVVPDGRGKPVALAPNDANLQARRDLPLLAPSKGTHRGDARYGIDWEVKSQTPTGQEISARYADDDKSWTFVYRIEGGRFVPVSSRLSTPGHMFDALPWAGGVMLAAALALFGLKRLLFRRRD